MTDADNIRALSARITKLEAALRAHHKWHLDLQGTDPEFGIDLPEAYAESTLCEMTLRALPTLADEAGASHET